MTDYTVSTLLIRYGMTMTKIYTSNAPKLGIVGAGSVGSSLAYASLIRGSAPIISLYDIAKTKVEAEVKDLAHGTQFTQSVIMGGDDVEVLRDSTIIFITAGAKQKPGQTRLELASTNARILASMMPNLLEVAPHAMFVLVTNPCDVLTMVARDVADLPVNRVFSSGTLLDTSRLRYALASKANVAQTHVHASIIGEHGDSEFPAWSSATISSVPIRQWKMHGKRVFTDDILDDIAHRTAHAAYEIIEGKGATNYAIGLTGARLVEALLSPVRSVLPLSSIQHNYYGVSDVALSVPTVVSNQGVEQAVEIPMDTFEINQLHASAETIREAYKSIDLNPKCESTKEAKAADSATQQSAKK